MIPSAPGGRQLNAGALGRPPTRFYPCGSPPSRASSTRKAARDPKGQPANVTDALTIHEEPAGLRRPILIMAFAGWNDAAESATGAARYLGQLWPSRPFASIDPEEFYHFGLSRPYVRFKAGSRTEREIDLAVHRVLARPAATRWTATSSWAWPSSPTSSGARTAARSSSWPAAPARRWCSRSGRCSPRCRTRVRCAWSGSAYDPELAARLGIRPDPLRGAHRHRGRAQHAVPRAGRAHREPVGQRAALHLRHREPQGLHGAGAPRARAAQHRGGPHRPRGVDRAVRAEPRGDRLAEREDRGVHQEARAEEAGGGRRGAAGRPETRDELPPSGDLVAEIEQFLRQQRPDPS